MKKRNIIQSYDISGIQKTLNEYYADWEIVQVFHDWHGGHLQLIFILEKEVEKQ